jgi:uncharacterized glyoxalase superfamily protein PhnB
MTGAPEGWRTITPRIVTPHVRELVAFLELVFGAAAEIRESAPAVVQIGDSRVMVSEPGARRPTAAFLYVYVEDVDATHRRAVEAGARSIEEPGTTPYGDRRCMVEDPWGNTWQIATHATPGAG